MDAQVYWDKGKESWLKGYFDAAVDFFESGSKAEGPYGYLCMGLKAYKSAPENSENGPANEYHNAMGLFFLATTQDLFEPLQIYYMANIAAKLGNSDEESSSLHPLYQAIFRETAIVFLKEIQNSQPDMVEKIDSFEPVSLSQLLEKTEEIQKERCTQLDEQHYQEFQNFLAGQIDKSSLTGEIFNPQPFFYDIIPKCNLNTRLFIATGLISLNKYDG